MKSKHTSMRFRLTPVAAALLAIFGSAQADENEVQQMITPESFINAGVAHINDSRDAKHFGQYTGMNQGGYYGLIDFDLVKRDDATGKWTVIKGRNLGLDTMELGVSQQLQGNWKYKVEFNSIVRNDPYIIHTGMQGIGSTTPAVNLIENPLPDIAGTWGATGAGSANQFTPSNGVPGTDVELKIKRSAFGISAEKRLSPDWTVEASFRNENKKGARLFGRAGLASGDMAVGIPTLPLSNGNWAVLLTPEPLSSSIKQFELTANYAQERYALSSGYYGTFYVNDFGSLTPSVPGTLNRGPLTAGGTPTGALSISQVASSPVALPPDNQAHQLYVGGKWDYSPATHAHFNLTYTHATQNESFASQGLVPTAPNAPSSLGGVVNTTLAQIGASSRAAQDLTLNASLRYEKRNDRTPVHVYNIGAIGGGLDNTTNWPSASQTRTLAKLDGTYRLGKGYSALLGADWENKKMPAPPANTAIFPNQVFMRPNLNEYGLHTELRKAFAESLDGAIGVEYKKRKGSGDWITTSTLAGAPVVTIPGTINRVLPDMYMDRNRSKLKGSLDWVPSNTLSVQTVLEHARDDYQRGNLVPIVADAANGVQASPVLTGAPIPGARIITVDSFSLDGSYSINDNWKVNGYWTRSESRWNVNKVNLSDDTRNSAGTVGVGVKGKIKYFREVGLDLIALQDLTTFSNVLTTSAGTGNITGFNGTTTPGGNYLPSIKYHSRKVNVYGIHTLEQNMDVVVNLAYQHFDTNDWQWGYKGIPFIYSDNTTVSQPTTQNLWMLATRFIYKM